MKRDCFVTTSWDDGHILDKKLVYLLNKYSLKGTFYIQKIDIEKIFNAEITSELKQIGISLQSIGKDDIIIIDRTHEIGAHTLTHPKLTQVSRKTAQEEIEGSKNYLENLLGHQVQMFCYPYGDYNEEVKKLVKEVGFSGARTVKRGISEYPEDFFEFHTTMHVFPHPVIIAVGRKKYSLPLKWMFDWEAQAKRSFDKALKKGGVWHLWGHSWEIEKLGMWGSLENVLKYISNRQGVKYLTNGECLNLLKR